MYNSSKLAKSVFKPRAPALGHQATLTKVTTVFGGKVPGPGGDTERVGRKKQRRKSAGPDHTCGSCVKDGHDEQGDETLNMSLGFLLAGGEEGGRGQKPGRAKVSPTAGR